MTTRNKRTRRGVPQPGAFTLPRLISTSEKEEGLALAFKSARCYLPLSDGRHPNEHMTFGELGMSTASRRALALEIAEQLNKHSSNEVILNVPLGDAVSLGQFVDTIIALP